jgi:hypothetical protein
MSLMELPEEIFADDPTERWNNARKWLAKDGLHSGFVKDICGDKVELDWIPHRNGRPLGRGAVNAWLLIVGPNPGARRLRNPKQSHLRAGPRLVLGVPHPFFVDDDPYGYWENVLGKNGIVALFFRSFGIDYETGLGLTFHCNLSPEPSGSPPPRSELVDGVPPVLDFLKRCRAKCVLAVTKDAYRVLQQRVPTHFEGSLALKEGRFRYEGCLPPNKRYSPRWSVWELNHSSRAIFARTPNHPSKRPLWEKCFPIFPRDLGQLALSELLHPA